ncbi:MAG: VOC family protein [Alphaproteobacteria bacterium]
MKRVHISVTTDDLAQASQFYSALFGAAPTVIREDYLKWRLDEPAINFAVELGTAQGGVTHLGIDTDSEDELHETLNAMQAAGVPHTELNKGTCCYAESEKVWTADPAGIPWEAFHTTAIVDDYGDPFIGEVAKPEKTDPAAPAAAPTSAMCGCC